MSLKDNIGNIGEFFNSMLKGGGKSDRDRDGSNTKPLYGVRILDLGEAFAGPLGATLLAEFGAEVIKVEPPGIRNNIRHFPPFYKGVSLWWMIEGRNKKSITVDMRKKEGQEIIKRLVKISDVVVENFRPGTLERWNLGYEELRKIKEDIILVRVTGFGHDGPYNHRTSYDTIGAAMGGLTYLTGYKGDPPVRTGFALCDYISASFNALSTLIALYYRYRTGKGQWIDFGQYEAILRLMGYRIAAYDKLGFIGERLGNRHPSIAPDDNYKSRDGKWIAITVGNEKFFSNLAKTMGREDLIEDPRFRTITKRSENAHEINDIVEKWVAKHTSEEVLNILINDVPAFPIYSVEDVFEDPHIKARGNIVEVEDPVIGRIKVPATVPKLSLTPGGIEHLGPALGQHNEEIIGTLLNSQEEKELDAATLIASNPNSNKGVPLNNQPLEGLRILDIGTGIAGSFGATLLADFGAEVIKVEDPNRGDTLRITPPFYNGVSLWWAVEARNKKSITLDLRRKRSQEIFKRLVSISDVVIESLRPGTLESWNLGYKELKKVNEGIILIRVSGFGQTGPYKDRPAYHGIAEAINTLTYATGFPNKPPVRSGLEMCDYFAGVFAAISTMLAIYYRDAKGTGEGQWADIALYEPLLRFSHDSIPAYEKLGIVMERIGNRYIGSAPIDFCQTKDGYWVVVVCGHDTVFGRLCKAIEQPELANDPRFATVPARGENRDLINDIVGEWISKHSLKEVIEHFEENGVPISTIYSVKDIFEDPHIRARGNIIELEDPIIGKIKMQGIIPRFSLSPGKVKNCGPYLGQHNEEIYSCLLGISKDEFKLLKDEGLI